MDDASKRYLEDVVGLTNEEISELQRDEVDIDCIIKCIMRDVLPCVRSHRDVEECLRRAIPCMANCFHRP
jgi:hypothetical protein